MTLANSEGIISNEQLGIYGFVFSPDFDTSQCMDIGKFLKTIHEKTCKLYIFESKFQELKIPIYVLGKDQYLSLEQGAVLAAKSFSGRLRSKQGFLNNYFFVK